MNEAPGALVRLSYCLNEFVWRTMRRRGVETLSSTDESETDKRRKAQLSFASADPERQLPSWVLMADESGQLVRF